MAGSSSSGGGQGGGQGGKQAAADKAAEAGESVDMQSIRRILSECGVADYEPGVVQQLLEFMYKYCCDLLDDAKAYSLHAGKKTVDTEDLKLAVGSHGDLDLISPPPRELLSEVAQAKNSQPLPTIKSYSGVRLPPEKFCLTQPNYRAKVRRLEAKAAVVPRSQAASANHGVVMTPAAHQAAGHAAADYRGRIGSPKVFGSQASLKRKHSDID